MTSTEEAPKDSRRSARQNAAPGSLDGGSASRPGQLQPTKSRRRPVVIAAGLALAIVGGLGSWYYASAVGDTETVLTINNAVLRGEEISADDLGTIEIAGQQNTSAFLASESADVIGQTAVVDLPSGSLVTSDNIGSAIPVESGESIVGVALTAAQMPNYPLAAGDAVRIVETPVAQGEPPAATPGTFEGVVFTTRFDDTTSQTIVDLVVPANEAADIAARGATGRIALVLDAAGE